MKKTVSWLLLGLALMLISAVGAQAASQPNIVFIMFDDLGNADLGYRGSDIKTPLLTNWPRAACAWSRSTA